MYKLKRFRPRKLPGRRWMARAAVAVVMRDSRKGKEILLMKRAEREGDPWSGDMAFPGGKVDTSDPSAFHAALRELEEEVGLNRSKLSFSFRLSDQLTKTHSGFRPMVISPFVFHLNGRAEFNLNHEAVETIWIPLSHFKTPTHRETMEWQVRHFSIKVPCYWYKGRKVWGLTLRMIDDLLGV